MAMLSRLSQNIGHVRLGFFVLISVLYFVFPNARPDLNVFNADDSEAYLALSYALTHGLGYTRNLSGMYIPHTTWPPGMPLLLAPVTFLGSLPLNWLLVKAYMIIIGLVGIALSWLYVRRLTANPRVADFVAILLATMPFYWLYSRVAMTETPSFVWAIFALYAMDLVWAERSPKMSGVAVAGVIGGAGMLLRGTAISLIIVPLAYFSGARCTKVSGLKRYALLSVHALAFAIPDMIWNLRNRGIDKAGLGFDGINQTRMLFTSNPTDPASPLLSFSQLAHTSFANFTYHIIYVVPEQIIPGLWNAGWTHWPGAPILAVALTLVVFVAAFPRQVASLPLAAVVALNIGLMLVYAWGGSVRFWIPITCFLMIMIVMNMSSWFVRLRDKARLASVTLLIIVCGANLFVFAQRFDSDPYLGDCRDLVALFDQIGARPDSSASVLTAHAGIFAFQTRMKAPMTLVEKGVEPSYTHIVVHTPLSNDQVVMKIPQGSKLLLQRGHWSYYALPVSMRKASINSTH